MDIKVIENLVELTAKAMELKGELKAVKDENKRLRELNDQLTSSLEKLAIGVNSKEQFKKWINEE